MSKNQLTLREIVGQRRTLVKEALSNDERALKAMGLTSDQFVQVVATAMVKNPGLAKVEERSLFQAVVTAAQAGLLPDGRQGALVPMNNKGTAGCQFFPMVAGLLDLARDALPGVAIQAHTVYDQDEFDDVRGTDPSLVHRPSPDSGRKPENVVAVYAVARHKDNPVAEFEVLYKDDIEWFRAQSRSTRGPWANHYAEMAEARALKRLLKRLPVGPRLARALDDDAPVSDDALDEAVIDVEENAKPEPAKDAAPKRRRGRPKKNIEDAPKKVEPEPEPEPESEAADDDDMPDFDGAF